VGVCDVDEFHRILLYGILWDIRGRGNEMNERSYIN
jgi:hypothetical protein